MSSNITVNATTGTRFRNLRCFNPAFPFLGDVIVSLTFDEFSGNASALETEIVPRLINEACRVRRGLSYASAPCACGLA